MAKFGESSDLPTCSFCRKPAGMVGKLIAGPGVSICNECVGLCLDILEREPDDPSKAEDQPVVSPLFLELRAQAAAADRLATFLRRLAEELGPGGAVDP